MDGALCLTALFSRRQHAWMPSLVLGVGIAEPPPARRAVHRRRIIARLIVRRHALTQTLQVRAFRFLFFHRHTSCRHSTRLYLKCIGGGPKGEIALSWIPDEGQRGLWAEEIQETRTLVLRIGGGKSPSHHPRGRLHRCSHLSQVKQTSTLRVGTDISAVFCHDSLQKEGVWQCPILGRAIPLTVSKRLWTWPPSSISHARSACYRNKL